MIVALDQQARLVPDRQAEGADRRGSCPCSRSQSSARGDQRLGDRLVLGLEHAPLAGARAHACSSAGQPSSSTCAEMRPTTLPPRSGEEELRPRHARTRVLARRDAARRPRPCSGGTQLGSLGVDRVGEVDERVEVALAATGSTEMSDIVPPSGLAAGASQAQRADCQLVARFFLAERAAPRMPAGDAARQLLHPRIDLGHVLVVAEVEHRRASASGGPSSRNRCRGPVPDDSW